MTAPEPASDALAALLRSNAEYYTGELQCLAADRIEQLEARIEALSRQSGEVSEAMVEAGVKACNGTLSTFRVAAIYRAMQEARDD